MKLEIIEPSTRDAGPILVVDADHNDIAEFYHYEHATVGPSYEVALMRARKFVEASAVTNSRPPAPEGVDHKKIAEDWYTWGFQVGMEAEKECAKRRALAVPNGDRQ